MGFFQNIAIIFAVAIGIMVFVRIPKRLGFINRILVSFLVILAVILSILFLSFIIGLLIIFVLILLLLYLFNRKAML